MDPRASSATHVDERTFQQTVQEALRAERSAALLSARATKRIRTVMAAAATTRRYGPAVRGMAHDDPFGGLQELPVLTREELAGSVTEFISEHPGSCVIMSTSGTSGQLVRVVKPREASARAATERRWFESLSMPRSFVLTMVSPWNGMLEFSAPFHDPRIRLRGMTLQHALATTSARRRARTRLGDLVLSTPRIIELLSLPDTHGENRYVSGFEFPASQATLFRQPSGDSEATYLPEIYSAAELAAPVAFRFPDCTHLHVNSDAVHLEILATDRDEPVERGHAGRVVLTDLLNTAMPLLRYDIGDVAILGENSLCQCGRATPTLRLLGRRLSPTSANDRILSEVVGASPNPILLVKVDPRHYIVLGDVPTEISNLTPQAHEESIAIERNTIIPECLAGLAETGTVLSIAERPLPAAPKVAYVPEISSRSFSGAHPPAELARRLLRKTHTTSRIKVVDSGSMSPIVNNGDLFAEVCWGGETSMRVGDLIITSTPPNGLLAMHRYIAHRHRPDGTSELLQLPDSDDVGDGGVPGRLVPLPSGYGSPWVSTDDVLGVVQSISSGDGSIVRYDRSAPSTRVTNRIAQGLSLIIWRWSYSGSTRREHFARKARPVVLRALTELNVRLSRNSLKVGHEWKAVQ